MAGLQWRAPGALVLRPVLAIFVAAAFFLIGVASFQDRLLYYPEPADVAATLAATGVARAAAWPSVGDFRGVVAEPPPPKPVAGVAATAAAFRGTAVVFHGNAGHAGHRGDYIDALAQLGLRVILAEYPGYGARGADPGPLGEAALVADARRTLELARREFGAPLIVIGESLGAGVASAAAGALAQQREAIDIDGLLLITPWDTLGNVAAHHYPWLPVRWLLRDRYDSAANLAAFTGPTAVVLAGADRIVPTRYGQALFDGLRGPKRRYLIERADHNDWLDRVDDAWWRRVIEGLLTR